MDAETCIRAHGGFASAASLRAAGVPRDVVRQQLAAGRILRPRIGWYCCVDSNPDAIAAVRAGGRLSCVSALRSHGVWVLDDELLHVACEPGRGMRARGLRVHTAELSMMASHPAIESPLEALERLARCAAPHAFVASADSAIQLGLVHSATLAQALGTSVRARRLMSSVDGRSESGIESLVRLALRRRRVRYRPQVVFDDVGRVDLLVGDRLIVELDSWTWHSSRDAFEKDRARDLTLAARGYQTVRITYRRVLHDWPAVERELLALVRTGSHLWNASSRRLANTDASRS